MRATFLPCASGRWNREIEQAKELDGIATSACAEHGQSNPDRDAFLCSAQRQQARAGFIQAEISTNVYGFTVRDTMNDGQGVLHSARNGGSAAAAVEFARRWHAEAPESREVIIRFVDAERQQELEQAISASAPAPVATTCVETIGGDPDSAMRLSFQIRVF